MRRFWIPAAAVVGILTFSPAGQVDAQVRFEAEWLLLDRDNDNDPQLIRGPGGIGASDADFDWESAYRFTIYSGLNDWEIGGSFTQLHEWGAGARSMTTDPLLFDDTTMTSYAFRNSLFTAATAVMPMDETDEIEQLQADAVHHLSFHSKYDDFELHFGSNRDRRWWRVAAGYRYIRLDESYSLLSIGTFDAVDDPGPGNDGLSHVALVDVARMTHISGAGDGWDAAGAAGGPDTLNLLFGGTAENDLHGGQVTFAGQMWPTELLTLEGVVKLGLYHNRVHGQVRERFVGSVNDDSAYERTLHNSGETASFVGSLGIRAILGLSDYVDLTAGYEANFISNVALSADQTKSIGSDWLGEPTYSVNTGGDVIIHGGRLGLRLTW